MTLNGVIALISPNLAVLGPITSKWLMIDLYCVRQKCSPENLVFSDISFMAIFVEVTENAYIIISEVIYCGS